jgi:hypothetical protein
MAHIAPSFRSGLSTGAPRCLLGCLRQVAGCSDKFGRCPEGTQQPSMIHTGLANSLFPQRRYAAYARGHTPNTPKAVHAAQSPEPTRQTRRADKSFPPACQLFQDLAAWLLSRVNFWKQILGDKYQVAASNGRGGPGNSRRPGARHQSSESNSWRK